MSQDSAEARGAQFEASRHIKVAIHSQFYRWLGNLVEGRVVLDAGCGGGFGTASLASTASAVVGIDNDPGIVATASRLYRLDNLSFQIMDCQNLTFATGSFDVVACNALLEYLVDVEAFVREAQRVLKPGGLFVCGTKNLDLSLRSSDGLPLYRNHLQEFLPEELRCMVEKHYVKVRLYGQRMSRRSETYIMDGRALSIERLLVALGIKDWFPKSWRRRVRELMTGVGEEEISADDFEITAGSLDSALYIIACGVKS